MMKKALFLSFAAIVFSTAFCKAQLYKLAAGATLDVGTGPTLFGPSAKYFFKENQAIQAEILFGNPSVFIQAFYQYHFPLPSMKNLQFYGGGGPSLQLISGESDFYIRPMIGGDYKFDDLPLAVSFDWRPLLFLGSTAGSHFEAARVAFGAKYVFGK